MELKSKAALVTGASSGIGRETAIALAKAGCDVAVTYFDDAEGADETVRAVVQAGARSTALHLDQQQSHAVETVVRGAVAFMGGLDILVNNAAWNVPVAFTDLDGLTEELWDRILATNLRGPFMLARAFAPYLKAGGGGRIVNVASLAGVHPTGSSIAYAASKAGLVHVTRCLAVAMAPHVTVNCVAPGLVVGTPMSDRVGPRAIESGLRRSVLGTGGTAQDCANQIVLFCRSDSVTGQCVVVDGGNPGGMR